MAGFKKYDIFRLRLIILKKLYSNCDVAKNCQVSVVVWFYLAFTNLLTSSDFSSTFFVVSIFINVIGYSSIFSIIRIMYLL